MAANGGPNIVEDGLVLYLDAANIESYQSGSATAYSLGNRLDFELGNGVSLNTNPNSFVFDGVDDYMFHDQNILELDEPPYTYSVWVKILGSVGGNQYILSNGSQTGSPGGAIYLFENTIGEQLKYRFIFTTIDSTGSGSVYNTGYDWTFEQSPEWINLTFTYSSTELKAYVNGILQDTVQNYYKTDPDPQIIGIAVGAPDNNLTVANLNGEVGLVCCHDRTLSQQEIVQNYVSMKDRYL